MRRVFILLFLIIFFGCKKDILPKPKAYLSLTYQEKTYVDLKLSRPYSFKVSKMATIINEKNNWMLTFDDGFKDHIYSAEILKKHNGIGIFFIPTYPLTKNICFYS